MCSPSFIQKYLVVDEVGLVMKNVLIIISSFRWGGINVALQSLLKYIDSQEVRVDVFVMVHSGNFENKFENCTILPKNYFVDAIIDHTRLKHGFTKIVSGSMKVMNRLTKDRFQHWLFKSVGNRLASKKNYDAVIGWHEGVPTTFVSHIEHKNKIAWIHCDYANYSSTPIERDIYNRIDTVVCVSEYTRGTFLNIYPELESRTRFIYNILDVDGIKAKAKDSVSDDFKTDKFTIVSVGRVSPVKQFCRIPEIARKVVDAGCDFLWYIIGPTYPGHEYDTLMENLDKYGVRECVRLLGGKDNPYPYIAKADLLVSTSLSESWGYTINEAKVLGVPSVSTDWGAAKESITNGADGFIAPLESIDIPIASMIKDKQLNSSAKADLKNFRYDNDTLSAAIIDIL